MLAPRTGESESGLWPTPAGIGGEDGHGSELTQAAKYRETPGGPVRVNWPTPTAEDSQCKGNHLGAVDSLHAAVKMFATPSATDGRRGADYNRTNRTGGGRDLVTDVMTMFRTPSSRDWKGQSAASWRDRETGDLTRTLPDQIGGQLNPTWVEWLMGYPLGWTACADSATPSSRKSRSSSGGE